MPDYHRLGHINYNACLDRLTNNIHKNILCNFHHQYLPKLLVQQLCDVENMCVAILCVWRLAVVHYIDCLSEPGVLM